MRAGSLARARGTRFAPSPSMRPHVGRWPVSWSTDRLVPSFSSFARARGVALRRRGALRRLPSQRGWTRCDVVELGLAFRVVLRVAGTRVRLACDCPLFQLGLDGCRHGWAALLEAGVLPSRGSAARAVGGQVNG